MAKEAGWGWRVGPVVGAGIVLGVLEAGVGAAHGRLALATWNLLTLLVLGGVGGALVSAPFAALGVFVRRLPSAFLAALVGLTLPLIDLAVDPVLPLWCDRAPLPWWVPILWLLLLPGLIALPGRALGWVLCAGPLLVQVGLLLPATEDPDPDAPLLVLITVDGLRADALDEDGPLARLADRGMRYTHAWAPSPHAVPSNLALLDRYVDGELRYTPPCTSVLYDQPLPGHEVLLNDVTWAGWPTAGFMSSKLLSRQLHPHLPLTIHDDDFALVQGLDRVMLGRIGLGLRLWSPPERRDARYTVDAALAWLRANPSSGLVWVHLDDPVGPYDPGDPWDKRFVPEGDPRSGPDRLAQARPLSPEHGDSLDDIHDPDWVIAQYRGEVAKVEHHLGRLLDALPTDASIVLVGTHGEALGEEDRWFRHGGLHPAELRVPAIVVGPDVAPGQVNTAPTRADLLLDPVERPRDWRGAYVITQEDPPEDHGVQVVAGSPDDGLQALRPERPHACGGRFTPLDPHLAARIRALGGTPPPDR